MVTSVNKRSEQTAGEHKGAGKGAVTARKSTRVCVRVCVCGSACDSCLNKKIPLLSDSTRRNVKNMSAISFFPRTLNATTLRPSGCPRRALCIQLKLLCKYVAMLANSNAMVSEKQRL